jgi:hypothetical protein
MEPECRKTTDSQKNEATEQLFQKLQEQIRSSNASIRRRAAYNLSWLQEDGLEILKGFLFGNFPVITKNAAAYGLRRMHGRMKKLALEALRLGLEKKVGSTAQICRNALLMLGQQIPAEFQGRKQAPHTSRIKEIPGKTRITRRINVR